MPPEICEVEDLSAYERLVGDTIGTFPVLLPGDARRERRWHDVLEWYRRRHGAAAGDVGDGDGDRGGDLVVCVDAASAPTARLLAHRQHRPLRLLDSVAAVPAIAATGSHRSITIVGPPTHFPRHALAHLGHCVEVPWGVVTACDLPGLTFAVAKLLAGRPGAGAYGIADLTTGHLRTVDNSGRAGRSAALTAADIEDIVCHRGWGALVLVAHGEGGHLNLRSLVLCGVLGGAERAHDGRILDGCRVLDGGIRCKRVHEPGVRAVDHGAVRAETVALLSCSSFPVGPEPYSSSVSGVLSALDGHPASVLATDRILEIGPLDAEAALGLLRRGAGLGSVAAALNDLHSRRLGARPYVLFGDAAGPSASALAVEPDGVDLGAAVVQPVRIGGGDVIVDTEPMVRGVALAPGATMTVVVSRLPSAVGEVRVVDVAGRLAERVRWFESVGERVGRAAVTDRALRRLEAVEDAAVGRLRKVRLQLEEEVEAALQRCEKVCTDGVWHGALDRAERQVATLVRTWDRAFADLLTGRLVGVFDVLGDAHLTTARRDVGPCDTCSAGLVETRSVAPLRAHPDRVRVDCPVCGERTTRRAGEGSLAIAPLPSLERDRTVAVGVDPSPVDAAVPERLPAGVLVVRVRDAGKGADFFRWAEPTTGARTVPIPVPNDLSPELHVLRIAWVHGLDVTVERRRWPSFPGKPADA